MKYAEQVTFGGSALDRAGEIRNDAKAVEAARLRRVPSCSGVASR